MSRFQKWYSSLSPRGQWAAGCAGVAIVFSACLYSLGLASYVARPTLVATPSAATVVFTFPTQERPTFAPPPTAPPTFALPASTLIATPTQAPIPTRAPPTLTPFFILDPQGTPMTVTPMYVLDPQGTLVTTTPDATLFFQMNPPTPQP